MKILVLCDDYWHPARVPQEGLEPLSGAEFTFDWLENAGNWSLDGMQRYPAVILTKSNNVSAIGGFLATRSYDLAFYAAGIGFLSYSVLLFFLAKETLVVAPRTELSPTGMKEIVHSYSRVIHDKGFMVFVIAVSIGLIAPTMLWILMPVYSKTNFGIPENLYGWIPTVNGLMCVFVQYPVTRITRRYRTLPVLGVGMFIYALGAGSVALMTSFWGVMLSMVILTFGELTLVPTASKYVADLAPADLRGRYMSIHWLGWGLARTLAPIIGGFLNDNISPQAIWVGGLLIGLTSTFGLFLLSRPLTPQITTLSEP